MPECIIKTPFYFTTNSKNVIKRNTLVMIIKSLIKIIKDGEKLLNGNICVEWDVCLQKYALNHVSIGELEGHFIYFI